MKFYFTHQLNIPLSDNFKLKNKENKVYIRKIKVYGELTSSSSFHHSFLFVLIFSIIVIEWQI